jgi:hypothetical protein
VHGTAVNLFNSNNDGRASMYRSLGIIQCHINHMKSGETFDVATNLLKSGEAATSTDATNCVGKLKSTATIKADLFPAASSTEDSSKSCPLLSAYEDDIRNYGSLGFDKDDADWSPTTTKCDAVIAHVVPGTSGSAPTTSYDSTSGTPQIYPLDTSHGGHTGDSLDGMDAFQDKMILWKTPNAYDVVYKLEFNPPRTLNGLTCEYDAGATVSLYTDAGSIGSTDCYDTNGHNVNTCTVTGTEQKASTFYVKIDSKHTTWNWMGKFELQPAAPAPAPPASGSLTTNNCASRTTSDEGYFTLNNGKEVYCRGDETLIYQRSNYAFGPDQMTQDETRPARMDTNSKSWYIPPGCTTWKWEVSQDSGATWEWISTDIPSEAYDTSITSTASDVVLANVQSGGGMDYGGGTLYYQKGIDANGCSSSSGTWYGFARSTQGHGDQSPNGIGGHCDSCKFGSGMGGSACNAGDDCVTSHANIEQYISNWKDIGGSNGIGGTTCTALTSPDTIQFRFWAK